MKTRLYLDTRNGSGSYPLLFGISRNRQTAWLPLGINLTAEQWNAKQRCIAELPPKRWATREAVRSYIMRKQSQLEAELLRLEADGSLHGLTAYQCRDLLVRSLEHGSIETPLLPYMTAFAERHTNERTKEIYMASVRSIERLMSEADRLTLEDVTADWLRSYENALRQTSPSQNARNIHLRNIRATLNAAIDEGLTSNYPFRRLHIKAVETDKRSMTAEQLATFLQSATTDRQRYFMDYFRLMVYLLGINITDLCRLPKDCIKDGRLRYIRAKTGKHYSVLLEAEAKTIIDRHKGTCNLLDIADRYKVPHDAMKAMNKALHSILSEQPYCDVTTYWARHSVATIMANELDIPIDNISAALGHNYGSKITAVYINYDRKKVDEANRRLIDYLSSLEQQPEQSCQDKDKSDKPAESTEFESLP